MGVQEVAESKAQFKVFYGKCKRYTHDNNKEIILMRNL